MPHPQLPPYVAAALKEWAAVCAALGRGDCCLLLRKGGLVERGGRFTVEHPCFWLLPTRLHQSADQLQPAARIGLDEVPPAAESEFQVRLLAQVQAWWRITDADRLPPLARWHVLAPDAVARRFAYRTPGLVALLLRVDRRGAPHRVENSPRIAGCTSWVELPAPLATDGLEPVQDPAWLAEQERQLRALLDPPRA